MLLGMGFRAFSGQIGLRVPTFTAYLEPNNENNAISEPGGITGWKDPAQKILWFGEFKSAQTLNCPVALRLPCYPYLQIRGCQKVVWSGSRRGFP